MPGKNADISSALWQIAALLEEQGTKFKPAAYRRAAKTVEDLEKDIGSFKTEKDLMTLPGIGEAIAGKIREFLETGHIRMLDELMASQGALPPDLLAIEDLGPARARELQRQLGITSVADLIKAAEGGKLRILPRFSETMEKKILENARRVKERSRRFPRAEVVDDVRMLLKTLRAVPGVVKAEAAGSFRRKKETVGDIDILAIAKNREKVSDAIAHLPIVRHVVAHGETKLSFDLLSGLRVDIRFVDRDQWGAALLYFTGDKEHNIALRKLAIKRGWKLNEYGLFEGERVIASKEEKDVYEALGFTFVSPERRRGDIFLL